VPVAPLWAAAKAPQRTLSFLQTHTGERGSFTYWENGDYIPEALLEISWLLRDHRTNALQMIDRNLLDQLVLLQHLTDSKGRFEVISGYRSPETNEMLRKSTEGVEKDSFHLSGRAIDVRPSDTSLTYLHKAALALKAGGVGYYPNSSFMHLDTGPIRHW